MAYQLAPAPAAPQELSTVLVAGPAQRGVRAVNAALVARTLAAAAARFTLPRPSAPMTYYFNPDGTVCTSRTESLAYDCQGLY